MFDLITFGISYFVSFFFMPFIVTSSRKTTSVIYQVSGRKSSSVYFFVLLVLVLFLFFYYFSDVNKDILQSVFFGIVFSVMTQFLVSVMKGHTFEEKYYYD